MKEIVQIKEYNNKGICLVSLRPKALNFSNLVLGKDGFLDRITTEQEIKDFEKDDSTFKVIALDLRSVRSFYGIYLDMTVRSNLFRLVTEGNIYLEIECNEAGYPTDPLTIYNFFSHIVEPNLTSEEALKRILEL